MPQRCFSTRSNDLPDRPTGQALNRPTEEFPQRHQPLEIFHIVQYGTVYLHTYIDVREGSIAWMNRDWGTTPIGRCVLTTTTQVSWHIDRIVYPALDCRKE